MQVLLPLLTAALWLALATVVPGAVALTVAGHGSRGATRLALAVGASVAFWPLALLWSTSAGIRWTPDGVRAALAFGSAALLVDTYRRWSRAATPPRVDMTAGLLALVVAAALVSRAVQARSLVVPAWVDGLHHTAIAQIIVETGALPSGLWPYMPVDRFYYHFGFHAMAAAVALSGGLPASAAVLWTGQALSALAALGSFVLMRRFARDPVVAVAAAAVPATLFAFPAYFASWSRYTQLAGLVALPAAWILLADASRAERRTARATVLAGAVAAGLILTHYRVAVFYALGAALWSVYVLAHGGHRRQSLGGLVVAAAVAALVASPWLAGPLAAGVAQLRGATASGATLAAINDDVPSWIFTARHSGIWMGIAALGVLAGLARRRPVAMGLVALLGVAGLAVRPSLADIGATWMLPAFSMAIALYLPVSLAVGLLAELHIDVAARFVGRPAARRALAMAIVMGVLWGAVDSRDILNSDTVIAERADTVAAAWILDHTPADARFLVGTTVWHLGTCRGLDGGYWLPVLAHRQTNVPPALYPYGDPAMVAEIDRTCRTASVGDKLSDEELLGLMHELGAGYMYVGPRSAGSGSRFTAPRLRRVRELEEVYAAGGAHVFRLRASSTLRTPAGGAVTYGCGHGLAEVPELGTMPSHQMKGAEWNRGSASPTGG